MTKEEYHKRAREIGEEYAEKIDKLNGMYAIEDCSGIKVGDIIEDHIGKGIVKKFLVCKDTCVHSDYTGYPSLRILVDNLTRKGEINKREPERIVYASNLKRK